MTTIDDVKKAWWENDVQKFEDRLKEFTPSTPNSIGWLLFQFAGKGRIDFLEAAHRCGVDLNASQDGTPAEPVCRAAGEGHFETVKWFVEHGARLNHDWAGQRRSWVLTEAIYARHPAMVRYLVEHGAEVNSGVKDLRPLDVAIDEGNDEIIDYLRSVGAKATGEA